MIEYSLVSPSDSVKYGDILSKTEVGGQIALSFKRVPGLLESLSRQFPYHETVKASFEGKIAGFATISSQYLFINGMRSEVGHISGLKIYPEWRNKGVVKNAQPLVRSLVRKRGLDLFYITVMEDNRIAKDLFWERKSYLPRFYDLGRMSTYVLQIRKYGGSRQVEIVHPTMSELPSAVDFINSVLKKKEFSPVCEITDDLKAKDCYLAKLKGETVGAFFVSDQSDVRIASVLKYGEGMRMFNFLNDILAEAGFCRKMPAEGSEVPIVYLSYLAVKDDNPKILAEMLRAASSDLWNSPYLYMVFGSHEADPLNKAVKGLANISYRSRIFAANWGDGDLAKNINKDNIHIDPSLI